jgi:hypothetical protein
MEEVQKKDPDRFRIRRLEERIAPSANLNPGQNNTNLPGDQPGGNSGNLNPGGNNTNLPGDQPGG